MPQGSRPARVGDQLRAELAELIAREVHDPGIGFLTLTQVKVTPDLQQARVYYTTIGDDKQRKETGRALARATPFLRRQVGRRLRLKHVPALEFFYDESIVQQDRIERIILDIQAERAENPHLNDLLAEDATETAQKALADPADATETERERVEVARRGADGAADHESATETERERVEVARRGAGGPADSNK